MTNILQDFTTSHLMNGRNCSKTSYLENCTAQATLSLPLMSNSRTFTSSDIAIILMNCLVFVIGTAGNAYVIHKFTFTSKQYYAGAKFIVTLALVDLMASFILPGYGIFRRMNEILNNRHPVWQIGRFLCYLLNNLHALFLGTSSWCLVAIACVRFRLVLTLFKRSGCFRKDVTVAR